MRKYNIIENSMGFLCTAKGKFTAEDGRVTKKMVYWSVYEEKPNDYFYLHALFELCMIKILAPELNAKIKKVALVESGEVKKDGT